jgi:hypothetical protein
LAAKDKTMQVMHATGTTEVGHVTLTWSARLAWVMILGLRSSINSDARMT